MTFDAAPGKCSFACRSKARSSQVLDSEMREIAVPDLTAPQTVARHAAAVSRARTARDIQQIKADPEAVPVAAREFSRTDRLLVRVPAYGPGGAAPTVGARC